MTRLTQLGAAALAATFAGLAHAQPTITSLGSGVPNSVAIDGATVRIGGSNATAQRWTLTGGVLTLDGIPGSNGGGVISGNGSFSLVTVLNDTPQIFGNTAAGVTPPFSLTPTLVPSTSQPAATESCAAVWNATTASLHRLGGLPIVPELMVYGSGSSGGSSGNFVSPHNISSTGRFAVGQAYISTYNNSTGSTISASTFQWRPWVWDSQANGGAGAYTVLPTPQRTSSNTWRRRTGNAYAVSTDGTVILGAQEHNVSSSAGADPDGGRLVVWRWNPGTSSYDMSYLPNGVDGGGLNYTYSTTPGSILMNNAGTIIVGRAVDNSGSTFVGKWVWNSGASAWDAPISLGNTLAEPASWLPASVTSCGLPPNLTPTGMSEDGSVVVGTAVYSTCGSFMSGGFVWISGDNALVDWYDYLSDLGVVGLTESYGPIGDQGDPTRGLPKLGYPSGISSDGNVIVGFQGGTQRIPGAVPWVLQMTGGTACIAPSVTQSPSNVVFSRCSFGTTSSTVILNAQALGTAPLSYQWYKGATPLVDGPTGTGSTVSGATSFQLRITKPNPSDEGSYSCTITGCNGLTTTTAIATVTADPTVPTPTNETCASAQPVGEGTVNFNICGAYADDGSSICLPFGATEQADLWYAYTPTFTGEARFQTCGSTFDTTLQLYSACGSGAIFECNNDVGSRGLVGTTCAANRSVISRFPVTTGETIYVRVGAIGVPFTNSPTSGALTISQAPALPPNDTCNTPLDIGTGTTSTPATHFNLAEATDDYTIGVDICGGGTATASNRDVWFRLTSECPGTYTIDTCGSAITNPMLHVFDGCFNNLIACHDNVGSGVPGCTSNQARITDLPVNGSVLIRVSSSGTAAPTNGSFQLTVTRTGAGCCGSADFDGDGDTGTDADIEAFFACLAGNCCATCWHLGADFNGDGDVGTDGDIEAFFRVLAGGNC